MANIQSVIKPGETILWEKPSPGAWDYVWMFLKPILLIVGFHFLGLVFLLIGFFVTTQQPGIEKLFFLFGIVIGYYPVLAGLFILYYIAMVVVNLSSLIGRMALTDQRFIKMTGSRQREILRSNIKNMLLTKSGRLVLTQQSGRRQKVSAFEIGRANVPAFKQAYHG